jgi:hypothetical protein
VEEKVASRKRGRRRKKALRLKKRDEESERKREKMHCKKCKAFINKG